MTFTAFRSVAQLAARMVRDHEAAGSSPARPTSFSCSVEDVDTRNNQRHFAGAPWENRLRFQCRAGSNAPAKRSVFGL